jgi:ABC-type multidrug transport system fused ATPase/permease subunit
VAIARAILENEKILVLDEATSSLDSESEFLIQSAMDEVMKNKTSIVIAHRLSTVINADKIFLIDDGKVSAVGTHAELLEKSEIYKKLYNLELKK